MKTFVLLLLLLSSIQAHADVFDMTDHSGIIKDSSGNYYKVNSQGTISAIKTGTSLAVTEKINIPTSKGSFATDLVRTAPIDIPRIGASVASIAKLAGPIGLTLTAVDLICQLSSICNVDGVWNTSNVPPQFVTYPKTIPQEYYCVNNQCVRNTVPIDGPTVDIACHKMADSLGWSYVSSNSTQCVLLFNGNNQYLSVSKFTNHCPTDYILTSGTSCTLNVLTTNTPTTTSDWDSKVTLLNDARFVDSFLEKGNPVPVGTPVLPNPVNVPLGSETTTTKDGAGNVTGTQTTIKNAQISQPSSSENPTNSPSLIKITENTTINNYNTSNQLTSSTSTVTNNPQPVQEPQKQEPITISIDNVPDQALQTYAVPGTFTFTSWGSGSCPADKTWSTMFGTHSFSYELTCDFATTFRPILLAIAAIVSFMIVASTRTE